GQVDHESRLHTTFLQTVAETGRLSSVNPNLQNVPVRSALGREIRGCFVAGPGMVLTAADYSQVELRILAELAGEPVLKENGRRRQIPQLRARNRQQHALGQRLAVNTVIQGTAADIIKVAMVRCDRALAGWRSRLILQIHDELLFEGPPEESAQLRALVEREM